MKTKTDLVWCVALIIIGAGTIILAGTNILGIGLPDIVTRIIGVIDLVAIPVLAYTTVQKSKKD